MGLKWDCSFIWIWEHHCQFRSIIPEPIEFFNTTYWRRRKYYGSDCFLWLLKYKEQTQYLNNYFFFSLSLQVRLVQCVFSHSGWFIASGLHLEEQAQGVPCEIQWSVLQTLLKWYLSVLWQLLPSTSVSQGLYQHFHYKYNIYITTTSLDLSQAPVL